ncbi:zinc finger protein 436 [Anabrus simplex]|uniref:zinc finger protein 436 n=1 Tax=Anabrus simplex TaxID=316456 RepID=UPI0035A3643A
MDLELRMKGEPDWLEETGNTLLVPTGNIAESRTSAASYVTSPDQLRAYMETITQSVAAKTEHADPALPALMVYYREGKDRVEETCTIFNYLSNFTEHGAQDPVELTEAVLPWAFIIRPENQSWFRCYEMNLSRDFQVVRLPGKGTRPKDNDRQDAATQTLREEKAMSNVSTQTARRQRHKQVGTDSCPPAVMEPPNAMTGVDGSAEVETDAPWSSETATQASWPDTASYTMQTSGCTLEDSEDSQVPASTDAAKQYEEVGTVAGHLLPSQSPGWEEGHFQNETCADVKKEVDIEVPAVDEFPMYIKEEKNVMNIAALTEDPLDLCDVPSKPCNQISNLNYYLQTDTEDMPHSCSKCNSRFSLKGTLKAHMLTHSGQIPYSCSVCSRMFPTKSHLKVHMLTHSGERPHICSVCNASFAVKGSLKIHMITHSALRPFQCTVCNKSFALKGVLKTHMLIHSGEKPHVCSLCGRRYVFRSFLKNHLLTHSGIRPFCCSVCNVRFTERAQLNKHMFTHSSNKPYGCNECNCRYSRKDSLRSHILTHSNDKPFFCTVCNSSFTQANSFKRHLLLHSGKGRVC